MKKLAESLDAARSWRDAAVTPEERRTFIEDIVTPGNIRRALWFSIIYYPVSLIGVLINHFSIHDRALGTWGLVDLTCSLSFIIAFALLRRTTSSIHWKRRIIVAFYVYTLGLMLAYFVAGLPRFGETSYYFLGALMMAVIIHLPPSQFLPLLLGIHAIFLTLVIRQPGLSSDERMSIAANGTNAIILACLAAWFLFQREWKIHERGRIIIRRTEELARANERMTEVMAIAAHDLRSPLASVYSLLDYVRHEKEWQREPYAEVVADCQQSLEGMLSLINRLLEAHRAESQVEPLARRPVDLATIIEHSLEKIRPAADAKSIRIDTLLDKAKPVKTNPEALAQALDNLLTNALKFSSPQTRIEISLRQSADSTEISVQDEGPGISEAERPRLFRKFHRGINRPTAGESSTGLGLYIVHQLAESLGARVTYAPATPKGSIFTLILPNDSRAG